MFYRWFIIWLNMFSWFDKIKNPNNQKIRTNEKIFDEIVDKMGGG